MKRLDSFAQAKVEAAAHEAANTALPRMKERFAEVCLNLLSAGMLETAPALPAHWCLPSSHNHSQAFTHCRQSSAHAGTYSAGLHPCAIFLQIMG